jgi:hypothetical protein
MARPLNLLKEAMIISVEKFLTKPIWHFVVCRVPYIPKVERKKIIPSAIKKVSRFFFKISLHHKS